MKDRRTVQTIITTKAWKDELYKQKLLSNPKAIIEQESGMQFPEEVDMQVLEEDSTCFYFVLPINPQTLPGLSQETREALSDLSEEELSAIAGGGSGPLIKAAAALAAGITTMSGWWVGQTITGDLMGKR